jgi:hypothetical protein
MKLLEETIRELKGEEIEDDHRATVNLGIDLRIDDEYIPDMNQRLMVYRKFAGARTESQLQSALDELRDRYGAPPASVLNLAEYGRIRVMADRLGVETIDREGRLVVVRFRPTAKVDGVRLLHVVAEWPGATFVPPVSLKLDMEATAKPKASNPEPKPSGRPGASRGAGPRKSTAVPSWWTARATAGEVKAGFTKEEILRRPTADPRAEGGMFARLEGLLNALS